MRQNVKLIEFLVVVLLCMSVLGVVIFLRRSLVPLATVISPVTTITEEKVQSEQIISDPENGFTILSGPDAVENVPGLGRIVLRVGSDKHGGVFSAFVSLPFEIGPTDNLKLFRLKGPDYAGLDGDQFVHHATFHWVAVVKK